MNSLLVKLSLNQNYISTSSGFSSLVKEIKSVSLVNNISSSCLIVVNLELITVWQHIILYRFLKHSDLPFLPNKIYQYIH